MVSRPENLCPTCQSEQVLLWSEHPFHAFRCAGCGIISCGASPGFQFTADYFQRQRETDSIRVAHFRKLIATLPIRLTAPILDVGGGVGSFLKALPPALRRRTTVVEPSAEARRSLGELGAAAVCASLDDIPTNSPRFAVVTYWDVLAHLEDPLEVLRCTRDRMAGDGVLVIKTPFHPVRLFRAARLLAPIRKGRALLHIPSMRFHFVPQSLQALLRAAGFADFKLQWCTERPVDGVMKLQSAKERLLRLSQRLITGRLSFLVVARP